MQAILEVRPDAIFIQSESSEYFHAENPAAIKPAEIMNARRFLSLDLNYGRRVDSEMYEYLHGQRHDARRVPLLPRATTCKHHCIMGNDYYVTNEHRVSRRRPHARRPARSSATTRSPGSTTTATACR